MIYNKDAACAFLKALQKQWQLDTQASALAANDADMLQVCNDGHVNGGMSLTEYQMELSMWYVFRTVIP